LVTALRRALLRLVLVAMVTVAGLALARIYRGDLLIRLLAGAAVAAAAISWALARAPRWLVAPASLIGLAGYLIGTVSVSADAAGLSGGLRSLTADALRNGIPRLLTALIPVEPQPDTVVVPVILTWLASLAATEFALRGQRVLLGCAPPAVLYATSLIAVGPNATAQPAAGLAFAALGALALILDTHLSIDQPGSTAPQRRRTAARLQLAGGAAAVLAAITAGTVALAPAMAGRVGIAPPDPRRYVAPPQLDAIDENPLIRLSGWGVDPAQPLLSATVSGAPAERELRLRLAVLNDFDGVTWRLGGAYRSAGRSLPGPAAPAGATAVTQRITVSGLTGKLLPALATPRSVEGTRVGYDVQTGTMLDPDGLAPGTTYTVTSTTSDLEVNLLPAANVASGPSVARYLQLGTPPPALTRLAAEVAGDESAPYSRALAIEAFLADHYRLVPDAPSGHAYPNLEFFLLGNPLAGARRGSTEQFAASFAVLARAVGLPTRIAVGFTVHAGRNEVTGGDALAWPEVLFDDIGWVPFDPRPVPDNPPRPLESEYQPKPSPPSDEPSAVPTVSIGAGPTAPPAPPAATAAPAGALDPALLGIAGLAVVAGLLLGYAGSVPWLKRRQRHRRLHSGEPPQRIANAFDEVRTALRLAGRPAPPYLTATEVAAHAQAGNLTHLARLVNLVTFAPYAATELDAAAARGEAEAYVDQLRSRRSWWRRLRWTLDPRPLRWHRRPSRTAIRATAADRHDPGSRR
jgi:transglutaminase-like putative cysteine protease